MKQRIGWMTPWMIMAAVFLFGCGAAETPVPPAPSDASSSPESPSDGGLSSEVDPCADAEFATSLSLPDGISSGWDGWGPFLHHRTQDALYLVSGTNVFRRLKGKWELFYRYPASVEARIDDAVLDEEGNVLYLSLHHSGTRDFDILKLSLADAATESLVAGSLAACPGDPLSFRLSFDSEADVLYAACSNRLFSKRGAEDWRLILGEISVEAVIGFSRGRVPVVCVAAPEGIQCREGEGAWFRIEDGSGVDSTGSSHEIRFRYNAAEDRLYTLFYRLPFYSDRRCRLLASRGLQAWEHLAADGEDCFTSLAVNEDDRSLYLVADEGCELSSYLNGVKVTLGSVGTTIPLYGLEGFYGYACPSELVLDSGRQIVYTPVYNNPCGAVDGFCASPRDVIAVCVK